jgi:tRNA(fMet)-specific endonuclease VapC
VIYLLDTNAVIRLLSSDPAVTRRIQEHDRLDIGVPTMVMHELYFGAFKSQRVEQNLGYLEALEFDILDFEIHDARAAAEIRATLAAKGTPIGPLDVLIAGQAIARDLTLVTHNTREFSRVRGLRIEDWEADQAAS